MGMDALWVVVSVPDDTRHALEGHIVRIAKDDYDTVPFIESVFPGGDTNKGWCSIAWLQPLTKSQEG